jgi:hypothetical protein
MLASRWERGDSAPTASFLTLPKPSMERPGTSGWRGQRRRSFARQLDWAGRRRGPASEPASSATLAATLSGWIRRRAPRPFPWEPRFWTVHQAKGRTFDAVVFYVPKTAGPQATCPSDDWWSDETGSEEQEIAFVACSRPKRLLVIAAHDAVCANLRAKRPAFHAQFRELDVGAPEGTNDRVAGGKGLRTSAQMSLLDRVPGR